MKTAFDVSTGTLLKKKFQKNIWRFFKPFSDIERKNFSFLSNFCLNGLVKSVFYVSIWTLRRKTYSKTDLGFRFFFGLCPKKISAFWQAFWGRADKPSFYVAIKISWGEIFEKKNSLVLFGQWAKTFSLWKLHSKSPRKILLNILIWKRCVFCYHFRFLSYFFLFLSKALRQDCQNRIPHVQG